MAKDTKYPIKRANLMGVRKQITDHLDNVDERITTLETIPSGGITFDYRYDDVTASNPTYGWIRFDSTTVGNVTELYINSRNANGVDISVSLSELNAGDSIVLSEVAPPNSISVWLLDGAGVESGDVYIFPVSENTEYNNVFPADDGQVKLQIIYTRTSDYAVYTHVKDDYTIQYPSECVLVDAQKPITITLPPNPKNNTYVGVWDASHNAGRYPITINRNGTTIIGRSENAEIDRNSGRFDFIKEDDTWEFALVLGCKYVVGAETDFIIKIHADDLLITLPLKEGWGGFPLEYDFTVDWGDGSPVDTVTSWNDPNATHLFAENIERTVTIRGKLEGWSWESQAGTDRQYQTDIVQWGDTGLKYLYGGFNGCSNLYQISATDAPNLAQITDLGYMFANTPLDSADFSGWDVSSITDMTYMFGYCEWEDINDTMAGWDVSNVVYFTSMFEGALYFIGDIESWDVGNATDMEYMLESSDVDQDLSGWRPTKCASFYRFAINANFSTANYDLLLNAWSKLSFENTGMTFHMNAAYTIATSQSARDTLDGTSNDWTINDGGGI